MIPRSSKNVFIPKEILYPLMRAKQSSILIELINHIYFSAPLSKESLKKLCLFGVARKLTFSPEQTVEFLKKKRPQKIQKINTVFIKKCAWCMGESYILHEHHYPFKKANGGNETVSICTSCHAEYHFLEENTYAISEDTLKLFEGGVLCQ